MLAKVLTLKRERQPTRPSLHHFNPQQHFIETLEEWLFSWPYIFFYGEAVMACNTAGTLEMNRIKAIIISKFGEKRGETEKEVLWGKCKTAIGQKCKILRSAARANEPMYVQLHSV